MNTIKSAIKYAVFLFCAVISAKDIYVAKNGNDSNAGTEVSPYLTLTKAAQVAIAGDIVYIREGVYEELLKPSNSGTAGNPIIFQSYPGEKVVISAMQSLSGWTKDSGSIYKTTIPFSSLGQKNFVMNNDTALDLARWPNKNSSNPFDLNTLRNSGGSGGDVINGAYLTENTIPAIDWTNGAVFFYGDKGGSGWLAWKSTITSSTAGRVNFNLDKNPNWIRTFHAPADKGDFYLEGVKGALDYQNEWWFNASTKELFVQLPSGTAPVDGEVKMRRREEVINLVNKKYIEIKNLAVFGGSINMSDTSTWNQNGNNKTTNNKLFGISSFYGSQTQGVFTSFSAGIASVFVQGSDNIIEKCEIAFGASTGLSVRGNRHKIIDCRIHDFNFLGSYDAPVVLRGMNDSEFRNNVVFNGGRDAVNYSGANNVLSYNDISRSNLIADDCALFYTVGAQYTTEIHHNWFHDAASSGTKSKAAGIYLDNDAAGFSVHHNVVWNTEWTSVQINWNGKDIDIFNNTLLNGSGVMGAWHKDGTAFSNVKVWNNLGSDTKWEPQSDKQNNLTITSDVFTDATNNSYSLKPNTSPVDAGKVIAGITDGFSGAAPDVGAYEVGSVNWVAGITWDPNLGPTGLGCYNLPGEVCLLLPKNDADKDGVDDAYDECPDTPVGASVNAKGCAVFTLENDNFKLQVTGVSCEGGANGSISIDAKKNLNYTAKIEGTTLEKTFTATANFEELSAGTYTVCLTTTADANYKQCFDVTVKAPANLEVNSSVNEANNTLELNLSGSHLYRVTFNEEIFVTEENNVQLKLLPGENSVSVKTTKACQGTFEELIMGQAPEFTFENPVNNELKIRTSVSVKEKVSYALFTSTGKKLSQGFLNEAESIIDMSAMPSGLYILSIRSENYKVQSKIIKK
ncbi:right-handed parallel beta-helix repeat-containing protein [Flavicella sediminum]|uniref:right-handed parallel beta-helix repeat-containing protein n=1 Tax=Flavicella sediminum TaxID=2585141 RepID=UPI00111F0D4F|nr:right-handed parallel beta-helix repeat-containing protein [Flavicella sediminum]